MSKVAPIPKDTIVPDSARAAGEALIAAADDDCVAGFALVVLGKDGNIWMREWFERRTEMVGALEIAKHQVVTME